jgi:hypothetical protein
MDSVYPSLSRCRSSNHEQLFTGHSCVVDISSCTTDVEGLETDVELLEDTVKRRPCMSYPTSLVTVKTCIGALVRASPSAQGDLELTRESESSTFDGFASCAFACFCHHVWELCPIKLP